MNGDAGVLHYRKKYYCTGESQGWIYQWRPTAQRQSHQSEQLFLQRLNPRTDITFIQVASRMWSISFADQWWYVGISGVCILNDMNLTC